MNDFETKMRTMLELFAGMQINLDDMKKQMDALSHQSIVSTRINNFSDWVFCMQLSLTMYVEANAAIQAGAWFAAATVAAAALEAVLLGRCFLYQDEIRALPKWQSVKKSYHSDFGVFARSLDLGKLLDIAQQLSWFPSGGLPETFRDVMAAHLDEEGIIRFCDLFHNAVDLGTACANQLREYRNLLHPAVCLKKKVQPSAEVGLTATFMFLIAFSALSEQTALKNTSSDVSLL